MKEQCKVKWIEGLYTTVTNMEGYNSSGMETARESENDGVTEFHNDRILHMKQSALL